MHLCALSRHCAASALVPNSHLGATLTVAYVCATPIGLRVRARRLLWCTPLGCRSTTHADTGAQSRQAAPKSIAEQSLHVVLFRNSERAARERRARPSLAPARLNFFCPTKRTRTERRNSAAILLSCAAGKISYQILVKSINFFFSSAPSWAT